MNRNIKLSGLLVVLVLLGVWFMQDSAETDAPDALTGLQIGGAEPADSVPGADLPGLPPES